MTIFLKNGMKFLQKLLLKQLVNLLFFSLFDKFILTNASVCYDNLILVS